MIYLQRHFSNPSIKSAEVRAHKTTEIAQKNKGGYLEKEIQLRAVSFIFYTPLFQFFNDTMSGPTSVFNVPKSRRIYQPTRNTLAMVT